MDGTWDSVEVWLSFASFWKGSDSFSGVVILSGFVAAEVSASCG
jgi:hypothetical protein